MIQADQRCRFREPVSLDHGISQSMPEFFGFAIERRSSTDHRPEFPSKPAANVTECPPATQEMLARGCGVTFAELLATATIIEIALDLLLQGLDHPRHGHQY